MLNEQLNILDVCVEFGIKLNSKGFASCPFHKEKTNSFSVKGTMFRCFGCGVKGDSIKLKSMLLNISEKEICKQILGGCNREDKIEAMKAKNNRIKVKAFEDWLNIVELKLCSLHGELWTNKHSLEPLSELFWNCIEDIARINILLDILRVDPIRFYNRYKNEVGEWN